MGVTEFTPEEFQIPGGAIHIRGDEKEPIKALIAEISRRFGISEADIFSRKSGRVHCTARRTLYVSLRQMQWSYGMIGALVGRDHTTIIEAVNRRRVERYKQRKTPDHE